jgi:hypothetical protein
MGGDKCVEIAMYGITTQDEGTKDDVVMRSNHPFKNYQAANSIFSQVPIGRV